MVTLNKNIKKNKVRIAIVASLWNDYITRELLKAGLLELRAKGLKDDQVTTVWVPGALEIPVAALKFAKRKDIDAVICLGVVIRGETYHFEVVCHGCSRGIMQASLATLKPVMMGVLTTDTVAQAQSRVKAFGRHCAGTALAMTALLKEI